MKAALIAMVVLSVLGLLLGIEFDFYFEYNTDKALRGLQSGFVLGLALLAFQFAIGVLEAIYESAREIFRKQK